MTISKATLQELMSYAAIVFGVLTQALAGIHLPAVASGILGVFGILLHPATSITSPPSVSHTVVPTNTVEQQTPVKGL
jgi:hypothetical protein